MDFLNKAYEQTSQLFVSMTPAAKITSGLLMTVIIISLAFLFRGQTDSADAYLFGARPLTSGEVSSMTGAFAKAGLNDWENEGNRIRVPRGKRHVYLAALVEGSALPQDAGSAWREMFTEQSPFETRKTKELRAKYALTQDLGYTIRALTGIEDASVVLSETEAAGFPPRVERRAVITVNATGTRQLEPLQIKQVRDTVAYGAGIDPHNIVVSDKNAGRSYAGPPKAGTAEAEQSIFAERVRQREEDIRTKIEKHLEMYPGATVAVRVELDEKLRTETESVKVDEKPTALNVTETTVDERSTSAPNTGRPGAEPNGLGNRPATVTGNITETSKNETVSTQQSAAGFTVDRTVNAGLLEKRVTVSIGIPRTHFTKIWHQRNPVAAGDTPKLPDAAALTEIETEIKTSIENAVILLIPPAPKGEDSFPRVRVTPFDDLPIAEITSPGFMQSAGSWFAANWQTVAMFALAFFAVYFLRSMIRSAQDTALEDAETKRLAIERAAELAADGEEEESDTDEFGNSLRSRFQTTGRGLRDELTELVREDPDAAASVLQNWIRESV